MHAPRTDDAEHRYLISCSACSASNAVNAIACWRCEQRLPVPGLGSALGALLGPPSEPAAGLASEAAHGIPPASFFPVLRDEAGEAANDTPSWDSMPLPLATAADSAAWAQGGAVGRPRGFVFAALGAGLTLVVAAGLLLLSRAPEPVAADVIAPRPVQAVITPGTLGPPPEPMTVSNAVAGRTSDATLEAERVPQPVAAPAPRVEVVPSPRALPRNDPAVPPPPRRIESLAPAQRPAAPPPVAAPCTPNIAALGLCSLDPS